MKGWILIAVIAAISFISYADDAKKKEKESEEQTQTEPTVSYEILQKGTMSGVREPMEKIIQSKEEWLSLWKRHVSTLVPQPPAPEIDFDAYVMALIFLGEKRTGGYQVMMKEMLPKGNDVIVKYHAAEPAANSFNLQVLTQPFLILKIAKPSGAVILMKE